MTGRGYRGFLGAGDVLLLDLLLVTRVYPLRENSVSSIHENT